MNIAVVAPINQPILKVQKYGGIEVIVSETVRGYCEAGHSVTLYAHADTDLTYPNLTIRRQHVSPSSHRQDELQLFDQVSADAASYDVIHSHIEPVIAFDGIRNRLEGLSRPMVVTMHNLTRIPEHIAYYKAHSELWDFTYVFLSDNQAQPLAFLPRQRRIYNGIDLAQFTLQTTPPTSPQLLFIGRITPEKGILEAVQIAHKANIPLVIAARTDPSKKAYYDEVIKPYVDGQLVQYPGEVDHATRDELLGKSTATLMPVQWDEPFGLVAVDSLASGTPVIATKTGALPEIIDHGQTGFLVDKDDAVNQSVAALQKIGTISRERCRATVEERFSAERMNTEYLDLMRSLVDRSV